MNTETEYKKSKIAKRKVYNKTKIKLKNMYEISIFNGKYLYVNTNGNKYIEIEHKQVFKKLPNST